VLRRFQKIATIAARLKLTSELLTWIASLHASAGWLDWNALLGDGSTTVVDIGQWEPLVRALQLRNAPLADADLQDLLAQVNAATPSKSAFMAALAAATQWPQPDIEALMGRDLGPAAPTPDNGLLNLAFPADFKDGSGILRLRACFRLMAQTGASPAQLAAWRRLDLADSTAAQPPWQQAVANATAVKSALRSKLPDDLWLSMAEPVRQRLRDSQRAALVAYLVAGRKFGNDAIDLHDYFVIDVEMSSCMKTTRLSQAICSVQLFVQRCLLNVETDATLTPDQAEQWNLWRRLYRVWQVNREVLVFPQYLIEPSQRDDKTPFFVDLENELQQNDITAATAEQALRHYLEQLDEVGRLEIVGLCTQKVDGAGDIMHAFGRTYAVPHLYYHRQLQDGLWSPWVKVDLDIDGDHLIPAVWNGHLYLCWPVFMQRTDKQSKADRDAGNDPLPYWQIQIAWSEFLNDKWQPKHISHGNEYVRCGYDAPSVVHIPDTPDDFKFLCGLQPDTLQPDTPPRLIVDCFGKITTQPPMPQMLPPPPAPDILVLAAGVFQLAIISFTINGNTPTDDELAKINVVARNDIDGSHVFTNVATKWDHFPPSPSFSDVYAIVFPFVPEPISAAATTGAILGAWSAGSGALASNPVYGVINFGPDPTQALDYFFESSSFTIRSATEVASPVKFLSRLIVVDLSPVPVTTPTQPPAVESIQPVGRFLFNACRADVDACQSNAASPPMRSQLVPLPGTEFVDMMMVESETNILNTFGSKSVVLGRTPGTFRVQPKADSHVDEKILFPFAFQDGSRTYYVTAVARDPSVYKAHFQVFFHPQICNFIEILDRLEVRDLLTLDNQTLDDRPSVFENRCYPVSNYVDLDDPTQPADPRTPREIVDFSSGGAYSIYNWEIFFHIPLLIATKLSANQRFEEARDWFHFIFDPTSSRSGGLERFWRFKPFFDEAQKTPQTLEGLIADQTGELAREARALDEDPFQPFLVARMRPLAFMKAVVLKYIDNLITWADQEYARYTMESVNEATLLYLLAARILGRRPEIMPPRAIPVTQTFSTLDLPSTGVFIDALVAIESYIFPSGAPAGGPPGRGGVSVGSMPLFCIPKDDNLLGYWDKVDQRLWQIRHCMNAAGVVSDIAPFAPKIDPALLVRAAALGVDLDTVLDDLDAPLPAYRFTFLLQKAVELCNEVKALGAEMLAALEKRDAERLALLRAGHELSLLRP
jgi:Neuraminidase-like domain